MAEGRFLSKSIATSRKLKSVSLEADYLFARLIPHLDRDGRVDGDPDILKAIACPLRGEMTIEMIATCLGELDAVDAINWYQVDGQKVVWIPNFHEHQQGMRPERERPSKLPSHEAQGAKSARPSVLPDLSGVGREDSRNVADQVRPREVKLREGKGVPVGTNRSGNSDKTPDTSTSTERPPSWPAEGAELWAAKVGPIEVPRFGKTVKPMVDSYGWPRTKSAMLAYIELNEGRARKLDWFVNDAVRWVEMGDMPMIDPETGHLTKRGEVVAKQAQRGAA